MKRIGITSMSLLLIVGCSSALQEVSGALPGANPIERGLTLIAWAVLAHAVIQAIFNK